MRKYENPRHAGRDYWLLVRDEVVELSCVTRANGNGRYLRVALALIALRSTPDSVSHILLSRTQSA